MLFKRIHRQPITLTPSSPHISPSVKIAATRPRSAACCRTSPWRHAPRWWRSERRRPGPADPDPSWGTKRRRKHVFFCFF